MTPSRRCRRSASAHTRRCSASAARWTMRGMRLSSSIPRAASPTSTRRTRISSASRWRSWRCSSDTAGSSANRNCGMKSGAPARTAELGAARWRCMLRATGLRRRSAGPMPSGMNAGPSSAWCLSSPTSRSGSGWRRICCIWPTTTRSRVCTTAGFSASCYSRLWTRRGAGRTASCFTSISTTSRWSTTRSTTRPATGCWWMSRAPCGTNCDRETSWRASAETSSRCCSTGRMRSRRCSSHASLCSSSTNAGSKRVAGPSAARRASVCPRSTAP